MILLLLLLWRRLLQVVHRLVDAGNTVVMIEHNLDIIKCADMVVDMGPEGGIHGGRIIAQGTPEEVAMTKGSFTGEYLKEELARAPRAPAEEATPKPKRKKASPKKAEEAAPPVEPQEDEAPAAKPKPKRAARKPKAADAVKPDKPAAKKPRAKKASAVKE